MPTPSRSNDAPNPEEKSLSPGREGQAKKFCPAKASYIAFGGMAGIFGSLGIALITHAIIVPSSPQSTFLGVGIPCFFALSMVLACIYVLSIRIEIGRPGIHYQTLFGSNVIDFHDIYSVSGFPGRGDFLRIESEGKNFTVSAYSFSHEDITAIKDIILGRCGAQIERPWSKSAV
jgi:hypothetical protein